MGSSASDELHNSNAKAIDASVGGLVWVRRRNGSWWPGRIMSMDEIAEGNLVSPRSGTPVKLLGRDDASVAFVNWYRDWYNLEKSKRVKAFRGGEYDECIERARVAAANGNRKAVKYARREDAILHALEIENARLERDQLEVASASNNLEPARESTSMSLSGKVDENVIDEASDANDSGLGPGQGSDVDSAPELSQSGISFEEPNHVVDASKVPAGLAKRRRTPNDSEDDGTAGTKRMRGLEDLGMGMSDSKADNGSPVNAGTTVYSPSLKRKRSQVANVHEFLKRRNRRRPLTKVLESTVMVSVPVSCDQVPSTSVSPIEGLSDGKISCLESNESKKGPWVGNNNNSDSTGVSCDNGAVSLSPPEHAACNGSLTAKVVKENDTTIAEELTLDGSSNQLYDVPFAAGAVPLQNESGPTPSVAANNISNQKMEQGTSKWQLKGKRNSRHTKHGKQASSRKYMDLDDETPAYYPVIMDHSEGLDQTSSNASLGFVAKDELDGFQDWNRSYALLPQRSLPYRQSRFMLNSRYESADFPVSNVFGDEKLYDVKLEVRSNYRPQHVPLVSLMSKFNGKAIIGHPLMVEVLGEGACDLMVGSTTTGSAVTLATPAAIGGALELVRKNSGGSGERPGGKRMSRKRRFKRKCSKLRKSGLLSKKIRKLSSLTGKKVEEREAALVEKAKGAAIACVPLELVFSRINEAVNGSTSCQSQFTRCLS
ncbi:unnamed protein product [Linum tenue]|uniref:PWWP domain-containing protein n=1 Tax=Linum tenue TaxID=586396 RepID=A0AAV0NU80_9ROSI|nr:unnamed protein product [Linum tenue]